MLIILTEKSQKEDTKLLKIISLLHPYTECSNLAEFMLDAKVILNEM